MRLLLVGAIAGAVFAQGPSRDSLNATAWMQTAVEYKAGALQAWRTARAALPRALNDKRWTASLEQKGEYRKLPPAIIVDVDETILDNSPGQARFLVDGDGRYEPKIWTTWTAEARAKAIPGAREFLEYARSRGVTVFYVTNRDAGEEAGTLKNLEAEGFRVVAAQGGLGDTLLLRGERPEWQSDKSTRRAAVAAHYRVVMIGGDDLNDFLPARVSPAEREERARPYEAWWGERWIVLPNAMYGSWEDALLDFDRSLTPAVVTEKKLKVLRRE
jgi:acid phosphatase